jgi:hypothetical protein
MVYQFYTVIILKIGHTINGVYIIREVLWFLSLEVTYLVLVLTNFFTVSYGAKIILVTELFLCRNSIEKIFSIGLFAYKI